MQLTTRLEGPKFFKTILWFLITAAVVLALFFGYKLIFVHKNPLPKSIKQQLNFSAIYPSGNLGAQVNPSSLTYRSSQKNLTYNVNDSGDNVTITESSAQTPSMPDLVYYESLGLHPAAQIQTKLGLAVLVNFYNTGNLDSLGQNGVLADQGTLLVAHPAKNMSAENWKTFFNDLHLYK